MENSNKILEYLFIVLFSVFIIITFIYILNSMFGSTELKIKKQLKYGRLKSCLKLLEKNKTTLKPSFYYNEKILLLSKKGKFNDAYKLCIEALKLPQIPYELYNNIAFVYYNLNMFNRSIDFSNKSLKLNSFNPLAFSNKGFSYIKLGDISKAENCFDKCLSLDKNFSNALLGKAQCFLEKKKYNNAIIFLEKFLTINTSEYIALKKLGKCYFYTNELEKSIINYEKAFKINSSSPVCACEYANSLIYVGRFDDADELLNHALKLDPFNHIVFYYKSRVCSVLRKIDEGFYFLERAIAYDDSLKNLALEDEFLNNLKIYSKFKDLIQAE
ncbi:tetratricopeptide repeat protein [Clostridium tarantellae]|uniref:Tetratricopeptide repeat protein n=1 Tax=Clostridium tarantellae TaxID=39493 RepID=A0A6I1MLC9_9CLOT|nr:tetratricopeptide repeat protein [Clostridium tarantellae]MPQ43794.1 tetratricopeptide repeat protein [Clostridium tarantellae]